MMSDIISGCCQTAVVWVAVMERFPRGTLPPTALSEIVRGSPRPVEPAPSVLQRAREGHAAEAAQAPRASCDLAVMCPTCSTLMQPEHAHYRCQTCGYRDSCCF